ncbi:hypothetical protein ACFLUH_00050 [Chloroflexota bacterium]
MEKVIKDLYNELEIDNHLTEPEYTKYVKASYQVLVDNAKEGKLVLHNELPVYNELKGRFKDVVTKLIDFITAACSEYEVSKGRPMISSIVVVKETGEPAREFYGLSSIPYNICLDTWERQEVNPPEIVSTKRREFWLAELQETLEYWGKHDT